jgi:hypothetical protein
MTELVVGYANEHPRKDQRRVVDDTFVVIDGAVCKIINISLRSFLCSGYKGAAKEDDEIVVDELLMADDSRIVVNATARVMRLDAANKELAAVFTNMNSTTFDTLEKMMMLRPLAGKKGRLK